MRVRNRKVELVGNFTTGHEYEVMVQAVDRTGRVQQEEDSPKAVIKIKGKTSPPSRPTNLSATGGIRAITLMWDNPPDPDLDRVNIYASTSFNWEDAVLVASINSTSYVHYIGSANARRYYWVTAVNRSGRESDPYPTPGHELVTAVTGGVGADDIEDYAITASKLFTRIPVVTGDSWTDHSPDAVSVSWNAHTLYYDGVAYSIDSGNTNKHYIYWQKTTTPTHYQASDTAPTRDDHTFIIATNIAGVHNTAWNSIANQVIGDAYIGDLNANKITAGKLRSNDGSTYFDLDNNLLVIGNASGITNFSDAGILVTADNLDQVPDGATYKRTTYSQKIGGGRAYTGLDSSGNLVTKVLPGSNVGTPGGAGLYLGADYLGYYSGSQWQVYIDNTGKFTFKGNASNYVSWNGSSLTVRGVLNADDINAGTLTGRTVQTASSGQRIVLNRADNTLKFYDSSNNLKVTIDDGVGGGSDGFINVDGKIYANWLVAQGGGLSIWNSGYSQQYVTFDKDGLSYNATDAAGGIGEFYWYHGTNYCKIQASSSGCNLYVCDNITAGGHVQTGYGYPFKYGSTLTGVSGTFKDRDGNTITVSGGIITNLGA